jgi:hydrogenase-4 component H
MAIRKPKVRELGEAIRALLKGPFTTRFPFEKPEIIPEFRGFPRFVEEKCIRCGACAEVCPADVILVEEIERKGKLYRRIRFRYDICQLCGQCGALCTTGVGIEFTNEYAKNTFNRDEAINEVEDEIVLCWKCGKPITTVKHLKWIADKIGEKAYANPTLLLVKLREDGIITEDKDLDELVEMMREDIYKILCPDCRRASYMKENFL